MVEVVRELPGGVAQSGGIAVCGELGLHRNWSADRPRLWEDMKSRE